MHSIYLSRPTIIVFVLPRAIRATTIIIAEILMAVIGAYYLCPSVVVLSLPRAHTYILQNTYIPIYMQVYLSI